jgi:hypothetical protein
MPVVSSPASDLPEGLPTTDAETMQHFHRILSALSLDEQMLSQTIAAELSPADMRTWIRDLSTMSVSEGVTKIRAFLARHAHGPREASSSDGTATAGDASGALDSGAAP